MSDNVIVSATVLCRLALLEICTLLENGYYGDGPLRSYECREASKVAVVEVTSCSEVLDSLRDVHSKIKGPVADLVEQVSCAGPVGFCRPSINQAIFGRSPAGSIQPIAEASTQVDPDTGISVLYRRFTDGRADLLINYEVAA